MSLDLLRALVVFSESGTVEEASRRLGMTQAGVSLQLKKLEEQVGTTLFRPLGRKKVLTDFARDLCQSVAPPLRELEHRLAEVSRFSMDPKNRVLRVGGPAHALIHLTEIIDFPGRLIFQTLSSSEAIAFLRDDRIDVALVFDSEPAVDFISQPLFEDEFALVAPSDWLNGGDWSEFLTAVDSFFAKPAAIPKSERRRLKAVEEAAHREADIRFVVEDWTSVAALVSRGRAWSVMPGSLIPSETSRVSVPRNLLSPVVLNFVRDRKRDDLDLHFKSFRT